MEFYCNLSGFGKRAVYSKNISMPQNAAVYTVDLKRCLKCIKICGKIPENSTAKNC